MGSTRKSASPKVRLQFPPQGTENDRSSSLKAGALLGGRGNRSPFPIGCFPLPFSPTEVAHVAAKRFGGTHGRSDQVNQLDDNAANASSDAEGDRATESQQLGREQTS